LRSCGSGVFLGIYLGPSLSIIRRSLRHGAQKKERGFCRCGR